MEANKPPLFVPVATEHDFPQLFRVGLETSEDTSPDPESEVKKELEISATLNEDDNEQVESTSPQKPASKRRKVKMDDSMAICSQQRRIKCPECLRYTAETEEKMARHIRKVHRGENPFQCYMCDYSTYNNVRFEEHVRKHQGIKPFVCTECSYCSASRKNLKKHQLKHKPGYPLKCAQCGFIGQHKSALQAHMRTHAGKSNATEDKNIQPKDANTSSLQYPCENCNSKFESCVALKQHRKSKKKCLDCDAILCSKKLLTLHVNVFHTDRNLNTKGIKEPKCKKLDTWQFTCQVCDWSSANNTKILLHLIHHPKQKVDENNIDISILRKYNIMG